MDFKSGGKSSLGSATTLPHVIALGPGPSVGASEARAISPSTPLFSLKQSIQSTKPGQSSQGSASIAEILPGWTLVVDASSPHIAEIHFEPTSATEDFAGEDSSDLSSALSHALREHPTLVHRSTSVRALSALISNCASIAPTAGGKGSSVNMLQAWRDIIQGKYAPASYVESYTNGAMRVSFKYSPHYPSRLRRLAGTIDRILGRCSREPGIPCFELTIERCAANPCCSRDSSRVLAM